LNVVTAHVVSSCAILEMDYTAAHISKQEKRKAFSSAC